MSHVIPLRWFSFVSVMFAAQVGVLAASLVSATSAEQAGLERKWFAQASVDAARGRVAGAALAGETLCVLSDASVLQTLDADTGASRWTTRLGDPNYLALGPTIEGGMVAFVNGSTLFVLDLANGREIYSKSFRGGPGAAPVIAVEGTEEGIESDTQTVRVYLAMVTGRVESVTFRQDPDGAWNALYDGGWSFNSDGAVYERPVVVSDRIIWTTDRGSLYGAHSNGRGIAYRFSVADRLVAPVAVSDDLVVVASESGVVYGLVALSGTQAWRTTVGDEVVRPAVASEGVVYVGTQGPALYALDAQSGQMKWRAEGVDEYLASTSTAVYCRGPHGTMARIDLETGEMSARRANLEGATVLHDTATHRFFLLSETGLVQCLQEPLAVAEAQAATPQGTDPAPAVPPTEETPMAGDDPFASGEEEPITEDSDDPFAEAGEGDPFTTEETPEESDPPATEVDEEDPFGDPFADF